MPCRALSPVFEKIKEEYKQSDVRFHFLDVDSDPENLTEKFNIRSVPTVVFVNNNEELSRLVGLQSKQTYLNSIDALANAT